MHENTEKQSFTFFAFLPPDIGVSGSLVSQRINLDEIYRLVSKILNFMACGSVFDRFCVLCRNPDGGGHWGISYRVEGLCLFYRTCRAQVREESQKVF